MTDQSSVRGPRSREISALRSGSGSLRTESGRLLVGLLLALAVAALPGIAAPRPTPEGTPPLILSIRADAKQKIIDVHGASKFAALEPGIGAYFGLESLPLPRSNGACPAVGYKESDSVSVLMASALDRGGAYYSTGVGAFLAGHPEIAQWCFAQAALLAPLCPAYLSNLAFTLNREGRYDKAIVLLERAKRMDPGDSSVYVNLAYAYQHLGKYDEAIGAMLFVVALNPGIERYAEMLIELQRLRANRQVRIRHDRDSDSGKAPSETARIDDALRLLEQRESKKIDELSMLPEPGAGSQTQIDSGSRLRSRGRVEPRMIRRLPRDVFGNNDEDCSFLCPHAQILTGAGNGWTGRAGTGGNPIGRFRETASDFEHWWQGEEGEGTKRAVRGGRLATGLLFYGMAARIHETCCRGKVLADPAIDALFDKAYADAAARNKAYQDFLNKPENFGPPECVETKWWTFCASTGDKGTKKFEVSSGDDTQEYRIHPTNPDLYGVRITRTVLKAEKAFKGVASAGGKVDVYQDCTLAGCKSGSTASISAEAGKGSFKAKKEHSTQLFEVSLENSPGRAR